MTTSSMRTASHQADREDQLSVNVLEPANDLRHLQSESELTVKTHIKSGFIYDPFGRVVPPSK